MNFTKARALFDQARQEAERVLIFRTRRYMRTLPEGTEFVCAMGQAFFVLPNGDHISPKDFEYETLTPYEEMFGHTYGPFRFTRISDVKTDW